MAAIAALGMKNRKNAKCCVNEKTHTPERAKRKEKREKEREKRPASREGHMEA